MRLPTALSADCCFKLLICPHLLGPPRWQRIMRYGLVIMRYGRLVIRYGRLVIRYGLLLVIRYGLVIRLLSAIIFEI